MATPAPVHSSSVHYLSDLLAGLILCACLLCPGPEACPAHAADIKPDLQVRERFEIWDGYNKKAYGNESINPRVEKQGEAFDNFILQRLIFGISSESKRFDWRFDLYDSRSWGTSLEKNDFVKNRDTDQEHIMDPYEEYIEPYELYGSLKGLGTPESRLIVGRQIIGFGDNRIFGPGSVTNSVGWIWDAARYSFRYREKFVDAWYGWTKTQDPDALSLFREHAFQGVGIYGHWPFPGMGSVEPFFSWKKGMYYNNGSRESVYYFGFRAVRATENGLVYDITLARELGGYSCQAAEPGGDVDASGYAVKIGWFFKEVPLAPKLMVGRVYASGDPDPNDDQHNTFARPFGTTDGGHYGIMDLMSWSNMVDNQIDIHFTPWPGYDLRLGYHDFRLDEKADKWAYFGYRIDNNQYDRIGNEYDIILTTTPTTWLKVMAFYGHFCAGDFIEKNNIARNNADRMVLQLNFSF